MPISKLVPQRAKPRAPKTPSPEVGGVQGHKPITSREALDSVRAKPARSNNKRTRKPKKQRKAPKRGSPKNSTATRENSAVEVIQKALPNRGVYDKIIAGQLKTSEEANFIALARRDRELGLSEIDDDIDSVRAFFKMFEAGRFNPDEMERRGGDALGGYYLVMTAHKVYQGYARMKLEFGADEAKKLVEDTILTLKEFRADPDSEVIYMDPGDIPTTPKSAPPEPIGHRKPKPWERIKKKTPQ